jgi:hypothetical protein
MLKKLLATGIILSSLLLGACAADDNTAHDPAKEQDDATTETEKGTVDTKTALVNFHILLIDNFKDEYQTYTAYKDAVTAHATAVAATEDAEVPAEEKPSAEEIAELEAAIGEAKTRAQGIADASAEEIRNFEIPEELEEYNDEIKSALDDLAKFYEGVKADVDNTEANEALFTSFSDKMGSLFEKEELPAPNYTNALS